MIQIGVVYEVPLALNVGGMPSLPLGGPGGHLSVLFTGFGDSDSLDPQYPGFNAIASPMNGRFIQSKIGDYPSFRHKWLWTSCAACCRPAR
jgi:hypothetical protein